ncbi:nicotinate-nucleotide--dimethylbenzimidazole phosphoribosyltransferase [Clostridium sp. Ade.TY]|uniref:nicotinate-nucleotide--dimethylbenzimidazole phosphoribosyltransferase n=1 Tax=Clostridium sp. Ade.TY TaxID=1391647 RepID=UPI000403D737|nr:nicotinate-nucleotide--dimethylbenzimidazole phosphoribosyltransferase [Clostridium sp. Ade.TY]
MNLNENDFWNILSNISQINEKTKNKAKERLDSLAKPLGSLGKLEDIGIKISGITGNIQNNFTKKCVLIFCADNGVFEEGIASTPQYVTVAQTINFTKGLSGVGVIARQNGSDILVVDVGINSDIKINGVIDRKIRKGTSNIAKGPAMNREECICALLTGIETVKTAVDNGYEIIGIGEMGIANTTTSSSILISLKECDFDLAIGKGAGLTENAFKKKKEVIKKALDINKPNGLDPIDVLQKVGGFDIAAMTGAFIGAAYYKIPVVIDGFISAVAALTAVRLNKNIKEYIFPSHISREIGYSQVIDELELEPMINLDMRLGEGSGCPIAFTIIDTANAIISNMATFEESGIDCEYLESIREEKCYRI